MTNIFDGEGNEAPVIKFDFELEFEPKDIKFYIPAGIKLLRIVEIDDFRNLFIYNNESFVLIYNEKLDGNIKNVAYSNKRLENYHEDMDEVIIRVHA